MPIKKETIKKTNSPLPFSPVVLLLAALLVLLLGMYVFAAKRSETLTGYETKKTTESLPAKDWKSFEDTSSGVSFKYPKDWKTTSLSIEHGKVIFVAPETVEINSNKIKIFVMDNSYFGMDGLPTKSVNINGKNGLMVDEGLYGFMHKGNYITLDAGNMSGAKSYLSGIVKTLELK